MGRNRQLWGKIFSFAGLIDCEWLYRRRGLNAAAPKVMAFRLLTRSGGLCGASILGQHDATDEWRASIGTSVVGDICHSPEGAPRDDCLTVFTARSPGGDRPV